MNIIYGQASRSPNGQCLLTPLDLLTKIPYRVEFKENEIDEIMNQLVLDNYFSYERAMRKNGDVNYIITLKENGVSFMRDKQVAQRKLIFRVIVTVIFAILSVSMKSIINAIMGR